MLFYFPSLFLYESVNEFCDSARGIIRCCNKGRRNVNEPRLKRKRFLPLLPCKQIRIQSTNAIITTERKSAAIFFYFFVNIPRAFGLMANRNDSSTVFISRYVYLNALNVFFRLITCTTKREKVKVSVATNYLLKNSSIRRRFYTLVLLAVEN